MHQLFKGLFHGTMVLCTFAAHFTTITGAVKVAGVKEEQPQGAFILAAAVVGSYPHITYGLY